MLDLRKFGGMFCLVALLSFMLPDIYSADTETIQNSLSKPPNSVRGLSISGLKFGEQNISKLRRLLSEANLLILEIQSDRDYWLNLSKRLSKSLDEQINRNRNLRIGLYVSASALIVIGVVTAITLPMVLRRGINH